MANRQVVALHEILGEHLPVRVPHMGLAEALDVVFHLVLGDHLFQRAQRRGDARTILVEGDVDPAEPFLAADRRQDVVVLAEAGGLGHERRPSQVAVEAIGPGVIGADDRTLVAGAFQQGRHAMQADIGEGAQLAVLVAQHHDRLAGKLVGEIVASIGEPIRAADANPFLREDCLDLASEEFRARIHARRHRAHLRTAGWRSRSARRRAGLATWRTSSSSR